MATAVRASDGGSFGIMSVTESNAIQMSSLLSKTIFSFSLGNVAQCVIPTNNRNELEIQFQENDNRKDEDSLVQITFHFPKNEDEDDVEDEIERDTQAESFQKSIMDTGAIEAVAGNVIVEFSKDDGKFVAPRNHYTVQVNYINFILYMFFI